ncbi:MAG: hypothetical protein K0R78_3749, partial [Pelosinus sp.]|nr:hypothetical protein [Pelosinus sp.]
MEKVVVQSEASKKKLIVMTIAVTALAAYVIFLLYKWFILKLFLPLETMSTSLILF